jgi:hypothetical protein
MRFTVGSTSLAVNALGRMCVAGNSGVHTVKLVQTSTNGDLAGGTVKVNMAGCSAGQYSYGSLASPVTLTAGASYLLLAQETANADLWYDLGAVTSSGAGIIGGPVYWNGSTYVSVTLANNSYGPLNFLYQSLSTQPPPPPPTATPFIATQALAAPIRNDYTGWVGMRFTVGSSPLSVTSLGRMCVAGNSGQHTVKLVLATTNADVPGGSVTINMAGCTPGQYAYASLPSAMVLNAGISFILVTQETAKGDFWYDFDNVLGTKAGIINGGVYWDGLTFVTIPVASTSYGPLNFLYQ